MMKEPQSDDVAVTAGLFPGQAKKGRVPRGTRIIDAFAQLGVGLSQWTPDSEILKAEISHRCRVE